MINNANGPAEAATSPDRGSDIPQKETRMNKQTDNTDSSCTPVVSRRGLVTMAIAVAVTPSETLADVNCKTSRLPPAKAMALSLEEQLKASISTLKDLLRQMHPDCDEITASRIEIVDEPGCCILFQARDPMWFARTGGEA